jgi:hypothetical protein
MQRSPGLVVLSLLALLITPLGCADEGNGEIGYDDLLEAEIDALCDYFVECGYASSVELCIDTWSSIASFPADLGAAIDNGTVEYDAAAARACLDSLRGASCTGFFDEGFADDEACDRIFRGTIDDGNACWIGEQCISGRCNAIECMMACCQGTCIAPPPEAAIGQDCTGGQDCVAGAYCDLDSGLCAADRTEGAACPAGYECGSGLDCIAAVCQLGLGEGEACLDFQCAAPFVCDVDSRTCQRLRGEGEACNPDADICALGLSCNPGSNTCTIPGGVGSPCDISFIGSGCSGDAYCDYDFELGEGTCQPLVANGGSCIDDYTCQTGYCGPGQTCEPEPVCVQW